METEFLCDVAVRNDVKEIATWSNPGGSGEALSRADSTPAHHRALPGGVGSRAAGAAAGRFKRRCS